MRMQLPPLAYLFPLDSQPTISSPARLQPGSNYRIQLLPDRDKVSTAHYSPSVQLADPFHRLHSHG